MESTLYDDHNAMVYFFLLKMNKLIEANKCPYQFKKKVGA